MAFVWWPSNDIWCRFFVSGEKEWIQLGSVKKIRHKLNDCYGKKIQRRKL